MAEKEYIDKVAFNYAIREAVKKYPNIFYNGLEVARQIAHDFPAADVRPVVFCKNCMHSVQGKKSLECEKHRYVWNNMNRWVNDEDFCCWGAKREES